MLGSNLFNTLAVLRITAGIHPLAVEPEGLTRDWLLILLLTLGLLVMAIGFKSAGRITRIEGLLLVLFYISHSGYLG